MLQVSTTFDHLSYLFSFLLVLQLPPPIIDFQIHRISRSFIFLPVWFFCFPYFIEMHHLSPFLPILAYFLFNFSFTINSYYCINFLYNLYKTLKSYRTHILGPTSSFCSISDCWSLCDLSYFNFVTKVSRQQLRLENILRWVYTEILQKHSYPQKCLAFVL